MPSGYRAGGLSKGNLFDTNIKATSIDEDIFTDQEVLSSVADSDLVLILDVSEDPDKIKYITRTNFIGSSGTALTGSTNNTLVTVTGASAIAGEANLLFDGTILTNDGGEVDIDISSGDPHLSLQIGGTDKFTIGVDDSDSDKFKIDTGGTVGGATQFTLDSSGNVTIAGDLTVSGSSTATVATTVTITDNESTDEDNAIVFTSGGDVDGGNIGLESDGDLFYNPSTGRLTATQLAGTLQTAAQTNITSLGTLTALTVDNIALNGTTIGHTSDTDLLTLTSGVLTVAGEVSMTTLDIGGTDVTTTAAEINLIDGGTARGTTAVASGDGILINDGGTMRMTNVDTVSTYFASHSVGGSNIVTTGALDSGSITSGFGTINNGSSAITTTGTVTYGSLSDGSITITAFVDEDDMSSDSATLVPTQQSVKAYVDSEGGSMSNFYLEDDDGTEVTVSNGKEVKIIGSGVTTNWTDTSTGSDADPYDLTITVDAAQTGITSLLATDIKIGEDDQTKVDFETADEIHFYAANVHQVKLVDNAFTPQADSDVDLGASGTYWKDAFIDKITTTGDIELGHASDTTIARSGSGDITIEGNAVYRAGGTDVPVADGGTGASTFTSNAVLTGNGTSAIQAEADLLFSSNKLIPTATAHNAAGTALTISAGATTAGTTNNIAGGALTFQGGQGKGSGAGGDIVFQTANAGGSGSSLNSLATALTLSDDLSATFAGAIDVNGTSQFDGTVTVGVDDTGHDVKFFGATSGAYLLWDESADKLLTAGGAVVDIVKDKLLIGGTAVTTTAAELNVLDAVTAGTVTASLGVVVDSNKDIGTFRNITLSGELDGGSLDISGNADIDGTTNLDAVDIDGNVQLDGTFTVGVDDTGQDVKFFGASAGAYMLWDESADQLIIMGASADATTSTGKLLLATSLTDINANDVLGKVEFQAPSEAGGTDAITVAAAIEAVAQGTFSASVNATDLIFKTGHSEAATEKVRFTSQGEIGIGGANYGTDGQVLTSGGAGAAVAWEDAGGGAVTAVANGSDNRIATFSSSTALNGEANLQFNGTELGVGGAPVSGYTATITTTSSIPLRLVGDNDTTDGPRMFFKHDSDSPADNDQIAAWNFRCNNSIGSEWEALRFFVNAKDVTNNSEDSEAKFTVKNNGSDVTGYLSSTGAWTDGSDSAFKTYEGTAHSIYGGTDGKVITDKLKSLNVGRYYTKGIASDKIPTAERHISPTAQDFYNAFGTGTELSGLGGEVTKGDGTKETIHASLAPKDMAGVGLMAIKELIARIETLETEVAALKE